MSGILDSKSRIVDALITNEGRRQLAAGTFKVSYVTFTDADVAYIPDADAGHVDPAGKIYLEAANLPQDQVTFEANDEGKLIPFRKQDIKIDTSSGVSLPGSKTGTVTNGRLTVYSYHHGRSIKVSSISKNINDLDKGFVYSDPSGNLTASVLINPGLPSGFVTGAFPTGGPYKAYIGTKDGLVAQDFATAIVTAINLVSSSGGPNVTAESQINTVFIDLFNTGSISLKGSLLSFTGSAPAPITSSLVLESPALGGRLYVNEVVNAEFASQITGILTSSFDNFQELKSLSTIDRLFEDDAFELSTNEIDFKLTSIDSSIFDVLTQAPPTLNSVDSLFSDSRMSNLDNFMYLPPIVKTSDSLIRDKTDIATIPKQYFLGDYPSWGDNEKKLTFLKLMKELQGYQKEEIIFEKTSLRNNVIGQFFEVSGDAVTKLDIVDFGKIMNDSFEPTSISNRVFFVGKTFLDNRGTTCFINMFTIIFSRRTREFEE
jgi:hypothetical protein